MNTTVRSQSAVEKILTRLVGRAVVAGEFVDVAPDWMFVLDDGAASIEMYFRKYGVNRLIRPDRVVMFFDHYAPADTPHHGTIHRNARLLAERHRFHRLHDVGDGISHQVAVESGLVRPGEVVTNIDSHAMTVGAVGGLGLGIGASEMAYLMATGRLWFRVPGSIKVDVRGRLAAGVAAKDAILSLVGAMTARGGTYKVVEFHGEGIATLDMASRLTLSNMCTETGAKSALFPVDGVTTEHYRRLNIDSLPHAASADPQARYDAEHVLDLNLVEPVVACPHQVDNVHPVSAAKGTKIHQAFLGTCTNGRYEDLAEAARILKGRHIAAGVRMIVTPASRDVYRRALRSGVLETLVDAGCTITTAGCGACAGFHQGALGDEEVCIASSSRNFLGRMGNRSASVYLASPATVSASAIAGEISDPRDFT